MARHPRHAALAGLTVCLLLLPACASSAPSASRPATSGPATSGPAGGFAGYKWTVTGIARDGTVTPVPARYHVYLQFAPNGGYGANDPVNFHSGSYHVTSGGFMTSGVAVTLVGYGGKDPVVLLAQDAITALDNGQASTGLTGNSLEITAGRYVLSCRRDGTQADFPPAKPT